MVLSHLSFPPLAPRESVTELHSHDCPAAHLVVVVAVALSWQPPESWVGLPLILQFQRVLSARLEHSQVAVAVSVALVVSATVAWILGVDAWLLVVVMQSQVNLQLPPFLRH